MSLVRRGFRFLIGTAFVCAGLTTSVFGVDGLALLKVEPGARFAGMGGVGSAIGGHPDGLFYNPASGVSDQFSFAAGHNTYWDNAAITNLALSGSLGTRLSGLATIRYANISTIELRTIPSTEPDAYFDAFDAALKFGLSYQLTSAVRAGLMAGAVFEKIDAWRGSTFSFDLGVQAQLSDRLHLGASAVNLGSGFALSADRQIDSRTIEQPTALRVGGAYQLDRVLLAADGVAIDDELHPHLGAEFRIHELFSIRAGGMFGYDSKSFSAGASFTKNTISIDYAFVPYQNSLGTSHLFSLRFLLGR